MLMWLKNEISWNVGLNARGLKIFIVIIHIAIIVIVWKKLGEKRGWSSIVTKFNVNVSFSPRLNLIYIFHYFLEILTPLWPNRGYWNCIFFIKWILILCNQGISCPIFPSSNLQSLPHMASSHVHDFLHLMSLLHAIIILIWQHK
jgi:hypothetical protein